MASSSDTDAPLLSHLERQVLRFAAQGRSDDEIASRLHLATSAVKGHLRSAFVKLAAGPGRPPALGDEADEPGGRATPAAPETLPRR